MHLNDEEAQAEVEVATEEVETHEEAEQQDNTDWKTKHDELLGRLKRAETKLEKSKEERKETKGEIEDVESLLLEVKGIQEADEVTLYEQWKSETGRNGKQILNNPIFKKELEALRAEKAVKDATPSSTKRGGATQGTDIAAAVAKYEQTGELPADFELRSAVVNKLEAKSSASNPSWRR